MAESKLQEALRLLREAGRLDILKEGVEGPSRPPQRASGGVAAAVIACSSQASDVGQAHSVSMLLPVFASVRTQSTKCVL
ncbi:hypothetical protein NDU88_001109 [Pleurodeles waltl]|uniref:Uncharacterized protein n=1 Tax=Pleurodeles waltl TaxID=8319 RepID=A0AAV7V8U0_PLEWA|nr:hypothetical protein NDU88_001109 [Pleurodeles waltl]